VRRPCGRQAKPLVQLIEAKSRELDGLLMSTRGNRAEQRFTRQLLRPLLDMLGEALRRWDAEAAGASGGA
jgi:hypothetical protein